MMWTKEKEKRLIELYPDCTNKKLCEIFNIGEKALTSKAYRLGLSKSKRYISAHISNRNKMVGRDLNYETLKKIASRFKTRSEFPFKDASGYRTARKLNILDDICSHMVKLSFSIPQLIMKDILSQLLGEDYYFNDRKTLKPYEIDLYFPKFKLGFEYNGKYWHKNNTKDIIKKNKAIEKEITLITIYENNRDYINDIKNQIILKLNIINGLTKKNICKLDVDKIIVSDVYSVVYNVDEMFKIASKYSSKKEFRKLDANVYQKLYRIGKLEESTKYFTKPV